jgi:hypothetical protein
MDRYATSTSTKDHRKTTSPRFGCGYRGRLKLLHRSLGVDEQEKYQRYIFVGYRRVSYNDDLSDNLEKNILTMLLVQSGEKNILTNSSSTSSTMTCHTRGLTAAHSRKLLATLGDSTSTRPWVRKLILKTCNFIDISNATIPTTLGVSTPTRLPLHHRLRPRRRCRIQ